MELIIKGSFTGLATNVSVQLLVASMGSINTENMVRNKNYLVNGFGCVTTLLNLVTPMQCPDR